MKKYLFGFIVVTIITAGLSLSMPVMAGINLIDKIVPKNDAFVGMVDAEQVISGHFGTGEYVFDSNLSIKGNASTTGNLLVLGSATTTDTQHAGSIEVNGDYITDFTGTNLENNGGSLDVINNPSLTNLTVTDTATINWLSATSSFQYWQNNTSTWAYYDTNWDRNYNATSTLNGLTIADYLAIADFSTYFDVDYNATTTLNGLTNNQTEWNTAYDERGSQIAGTHLTWDGSELDADDNLSDYTNDLGWTTWATSSAQNFWNVTSTWAGFTGEFDKYANASTTIGNKTYSDLEGSPSDVITSGTGLHWTNDTLNMNTRISLTSVTTTEYIEIGAGGCTKIGYSGGDLCVSGDMEVQGDTYVVDVYMASTTANNLRVDGNATTTGYSSIGVDDGKFNYTAGDLNASGDLYVGGYASSTGGLYTQGSAHIGGNTTMDGTLRLDTSKGYFNVIATDNIRNSTESETIVWSVANNRWESSAGMTFPSATTTNLYTSNGFGLNGIYINDWSDLSNLGINPFDQWLDTTSTVQFGSASTTDTFYAGGYASSTGGFYTQGSGHFGSNLTIDDTLTANWLSATSSLDYWLNSSSTNATADDITTDIATHTAVVEAHQPKVTLAGEDYLSIVDATQVITSANIDADNIDLTDTFAWTGTHTFDWLSATSSLEYFRNTTTTWASYDTNWERNYNATTTLNGFTDNSANWNTAYNERGSQIAGTHLTWDGSELDVDDNLSDYTNDLGWTTWATSSAQNFWNVTTTWAGFGGEFTKYGNASTTIGNKSYSDLEGSPSDVITDGTNLSWDGDTLNASGGAVTSITFSTLTYDGEIASGGYTGYYAADLICNGDEAGSHFCDTGEVGLFLTGNASSTIDGVTAWVKEYAPGYTANANDCNGFTNNSATYLGAFLDNTGGVTASSESYWLTNCSVSKKLTCCK